MSTDHFDKRTETGLKLGKQLAQDCSGLTPPGSGSGHHLEKPRGWEGATPDPTSHGAAPVVSHSSIRSLESTTVSMLDSHSITNQTQAPQWTHLMHIPVEGPVLAAHQLPGRCLWSGPRHRCCGSEIQLLRDVEGSTDWSSLGNPPGV